MAVWPRRGVAERRRDSRRCTGRRDGSGRAGRHAGHPAARGTRGHGVLQRVAQESFVRAWPGSREEKEGEGKRKEKGEREKGKMEKKKRGKRKKERGKKEEEAPAGFAATVASRAWRRRKATHMRNEENREKIRW